MSNHRQEIEELIKAVVSNLVEATNKELQIYAHEIAKNLQLVLLRREAGEDVSKELMLLRAQAKILAMRHMLRCGETTAATLADIFTIVLKLAFRITSKS